MAASKLRATTIADMVPTGLSANAAVTGRNQASPEFPRARRLGGAIPAFIISLCQMESAPVEAAGGTDANPPADAPKTSLAVLLRKVCGHNSATNPVRP